MSGASFNKLNVLPRKLQRELGVEMAQGSFVGQGLEAVALLEKDLAGDILVSW